MADSELRLFRTDPAGFLPELDDLGLEEAIGEGAAATKERAEAALHETPLSLEGAAALLFSRRGPEPAALLQRAGELTRARFSRRILLYAPCYLSNWCVNHCRYCGFNFTREVPRRFLSPDEALREISLLADRGFRRILLVAGEYPRMVTEIYLSEVIRRARAIVPEIDLEVAPALAGTYATWVAAGAGGVTCYQETYDREVYATMHPRGPKSYFDYRIGTLERAAEGGMKRLGLGALLDLAEPRREILSLIAHARYLMKRFPAVRLTVSLPRLRLAVPGFVPGYVVDGASLVRFYAVLRLALPDAGLIVSTREPPVQRLRLLEAGITQMSAGSVTVPGGYAGERAGEHFAGEQFPVADHRSVDEVRAELDKRGYEPSWT